MFAVCGVTCSIVLRVDTLGKEFFVAEQLFHSAFLSYRQSGSQTLTQLHNYRTLYKKHVTEMSTHIERARKRGQEVAELKKSGEITALQYQLGAKNK